MPEPKKGKRSYNAQVDSQVSGLRLVRQQRPAASATRQRQTRRFVWRAFHRRSARRGTGNRFKTDRFYQNDLGQTLRIMKTSSTPLPIDALRAAFGDALQVNASLAGYTTARVGGPADALLVASSAAELEQIARRLWELDVPFYVLGYGSNVLVQRQRAARRGGSQPRAGHPDRRLKATRPRFGPNPAR